MTVICGKVEAIGVGLAADSRSIQHDLILPAQEKLIRSDRWLFGHTGDVRARDVLSQNKYRFDSAVDIGAFVNLVKTIFKEDGMDLKPHPADEACQMSGQHLLITDGSRLYFIGGSFSTSEIPDFMAIGSGRSFALGAMAHGASVVEAAETACRFDPNCGGEILSDALMKQLHEAA